MPFARPSLSDLITRVKGDIRGRLEITNPLLRRAMADVLGTVWAGAVHLAYGYLDWLWRQLFADQSDADQLARQAATYGMSPIAAAFATGTATATGTNGSPISAGTILQLDSVTSYEVTANATIASGTATLAIEAVLAGSTANVPASTVLTFQSSVAGVNATVSVVADITNGLDQETTDEFRARFLLRKRQPPEGGANQDYEAWVLAAGVGATRTWVFPNGAGLGTVVVYFVEDNNESSIFPSGGDISTAQAYVNGQRPTTAAVTVAAPGDLAVPFTIHIVPSNSTTQAAVAAELADLFSRLGAAGDGISQGEIPLSQMLTAIGNAAGVTDFSLTSPSSNVVPGLGQLPTVGTITWT